MGRMAEPDIPPERLRLGVLTKCGSSNKANGLPLSEGRPVNLMLCVTKQKIYSRKYIP
jgi:hypothetical protein